MLSKIFTKLLNIPIKEYLIKIYNFFLVILAGGFDVFKRLVFVQLVIWLLFYAIEQTQFFTELMITLKKITQVCNELTSQDIKTLINTLQEINTKMSFDLTSLESKSQVNNEFSIIESSNHNSVTKKKGLSFDISGDFAKVFPSKK